jgi:hypothetical protein
LSSGPSDHIDIDSLAHTVRYKEKVLCAPGEWWVAPTTNTNTPMPDFNNQVMDPNEEVLNIPGYILDGIEPKYNRQAINKPNADLWHTAIEAEIDGVRHNHT